jgi:hypothetical protein
MNTGILLIVVLIAFLLIMVISVISFGIIFTLRKRLVAVVIMPDKHLVNKRVTGTIPDKIVIGECAYFVDDECFVKTFWGDKIFYFFNNPYPIKFDAMANRPTMVGTKAQDLKTFHESNLIKQLFSTDDLDRLIMFLVIGVGAICLVILVLQFGHKPVELSNTGNNTQMIADACRLGMRLSNPTI